MSKYRTTIAKINGRTVYYVYRLKDPTREDKEMNRRYIGSFDNEDRAREYKGALETMPEPEGEG